MAARLVGGGTIYVVCGDRPAPAGLTLDTRATAPHRLEPSNMGFRERLRRRGVVPQMQVDGVSSAVCHRHVGDDPVSFADLQASRRPPDDRALRDRPDGLTTSDVDGKRTRLNTRT